MSEAINIYQVFTRLFRNDNNTKTKFGTKEENGCSKFSDFTEKALSEIKSMGINYIWYTGVLRHTTTTDYTKYGIKNINPRVIKGRAGSPYAIVDYYDVDPDLADDVNNRLNEYLQLIARTHDAGLKCIMDFVPNHVAREYKSEKLPKGAIDLGANDDKTKSFSSENNFYYIPNTEFVEPNGIDFPYTKDVDVYRESPAKVTGNDAFTNTPSINDWYETIKLNYGIDYQNQWNRHFEPIPNTWFRMCEILTYWAKLGVDGFRCDMAEMVPAEFWGWVIPQIKAINPSILFIAEVYNPQEYRNYTKKGKFDYLYDKVGLYDILRLLMENHGSAKYISDYWKSINGLQNQMLRFLENHDEQRIASPQFAGTSQMGIPAMIVSATMNCGPTMLYFAQEIGEPAIDEEGFSGRDGRTTIFDYWQVSEYQKWVNAGKFDGEKLSSEQRRLRDFYSRLMNLRLQSDAIQNGEFFDIMYANYGGNVDADKVYAYIRHSAKQKLLVIVNFDRYAPKDVRLFIPQLALSVCGLEKEKLYQMHDLLWGRYLNVLSMTQAVNDGFSITIEPMSGMILELVEG